MSAPDCSAVSRVSGVDRPQILTISGMVEYGLLGRGSERGVAGRVLQRRALLVSPREPVAARLRQSRKPLRVVPRGRFRRTQVGQFPSRLPRIGLMLARRAAPTALPE